MCVCVCVCVSVCAGGGGGDVHCVKKSENDITLHGRVVFHKHNLCKNVENIGWSIAPFRFKGKFP